MARAVRSELGEARQLGQQDCPPAFAAGADAFGGYAAGQAHAGRGDDPGPEAVTGLDAGQGAGSAARVAWAGRAEGGEARQHIDQERVGRLPAGAVAGGGVPAVQPYTGPGDGPRPELVTGLDGQVGSAAGQTSLVARAVRAELGQAGKLSEPERPRAVTAGADAFGGVAAGWVLRVLPQPQAGLRHDPRAEPVAGLDVQPRSGRAATLAGHAHRSAACLISASDSSRSAAAAYRSSNANR